MEAGALSSQSRGLVSGSGAELPRAWVPLRGSVQAGSQRKKLSSENVDGQLTYYDDAVVPQPPFKFSFNRISLSSAVLS